MVIIFLVGYFFIIFEHLLKINKAGSALMMGALCWLLQFTSLDLSLEDNLTHLSAHLADISQVIIFLFGAMIIVETISVHQGFNFLTSKLNILNKRTLLWMVGVLTFFLSSVLDNLTTTIVMISILQKIIDDKNDKILFGGGIVIAANAGGAWTPIGDVTTTMLWIGGQISTLSTLLQLILPSLACFTVAFACITFMVKGEIPKKEVSIQKEPLGLTVFTLGLGVLIFVPILKVITGLPPFIAIILGLSLMWLLTDLLHAKRPGRDHLKILQVIPKVDLSGPVFFLGILLAINALETAGVLTQLSRLIDHTIGNPTVIAATIGLASSVVDNIPLVAAAMGMYDLASFPIDCSFWQLVAYCAGTGGSIFIIGSAAGVVLMSMENVNFFTYLKKISLAATAGYFAGIIVYLLI